MSRTTAPDRPLTSTTAGTERSARDAQDARRIPGIDGLRAVAVLGVMAFHFELGLDGGFLGVNLFFVISGFVITRLLAAERPSAGRTGPARIRLGRFWFRRVKRLMPALFVTVAAVQVWMVLQDPPGLRPTTNGQTLAALGYVSNWYAIVAQVDYWAVAGSAAPLSHLWSLAVEEQFYLCWPVLLAVGLGCAAVRRRPGLMAAVVAGGAAVSYGLAALLYVPGAPDRVYLGTDTRVGALLLGAAVALAPSWPRRLRAAAVPAAGCLAAVWCVAAIDSAALYLWQLPLVGVAAALLIGALGRGGAPGERLLTLGPVLWVGRVSYPLYLWHWPVWVYLGTVYPGWAPAQRVAVALAASFVLAALTYHLLERPIQRSSPRPRVLLPLAAAGCVALAGVALIPLAPAMDARTDGPVVTGPGVH